MFDNRLQIVETLPSPSSAPTALDSAHSVRPTRQEAEAAVRTLIRWAGDKPMREGLTDTPARVVRAYEEWFGGYDLDPEDILGRTFDRAGYDDIVLLRDIPVRSVCEHHMAPIRGVAHVAYLPGERVVGISKLARLVDASEFEEFKQHYGTTLPADPGAADRRNRRYARARVAATRRRGRRQRHPRMHLVTRYRHAGRCDGDPAPAGAVRPGTRPA